MLTKWDEAQDKVNTTAHLWFLLWKQEQISVHPRKGCDLGWEQPKEVIPLKSALVNLSDFIEVPYKNMG